MSVLIHALAVHDLAVHAMTGPHVAGGVPNPAPAPPPGLASRVDTLLAWWKWGSLIAGVFGLGKGLGRDLVPGRLHDLLERGVSALCPATL